MPFEPLLIVGVLLWLSILAYLDWREGEFSHWSTTVPMIIAGLWRVIHPPAETWWPAGVAMLFMLVGILLSDEVGLLGAFGLAAAGLGVTANFPTAVMIATWFVALVGFTWDVWSGGDAKIVMVLLALWPNVELLGSLLFALLLGSFVVLFQRFGGTVPVIMLHAAASLRRGERPTEDQATPAPLGPWLLLGTVGYVVWSVL